MLDPMVRYRSWPFLSTSARWALFFGILHFFGNDIVFWLVGRRPMAFYAVDYLPRLLLILWLWAVSRGPEGADLLSLRNPGGGALLILAAAASAWGIAADQFGWVWLSLHLPDTALLRVCPMLPGGWRWADTLAGSAVVALSEEGLFRGLLLAALLSPQGPTGKAVSRQREVWALLVSSVAFGLAHWSLGLHAIVATSVWALLPGALVIRYRTIWPAVIAHYLTDVVAFSGVITPLVYRLL